MIRFETKPELNGKLTVGASVFLSWNLKAKANITLYQRYETKDGAYSKFIDQICSNVKYKYKWVVPQHLSNKSDLFLCLHPTKGNLNTTSQCFAVVDKNENDLVNKSYNNNTSAKSRTNNVADKYVNNIDNKNMNKTKEHGLKISNRVLSFLDKIANPQHQQRRLPREKLIGRRAPSWIVSGGKNAFHRKSTNSSFQSLLPLLKDGKPVSGCYYHTIGKTGYFECKILDCEPFSTEIGIGLAGENFPIMNKIVGNTEDSYGYLSNTGSVVTNDDHATRKSTQTFGSGDTVGCGIHIESGDVFFTLNGILVSVAFPGTLRYSKRETIYPTVSGSGRAEIQFIFGNEKFKFQQFAEVSRLCERQHRRRRSWGIDDLPPGTSMNDVEAKKDHTRKSQIFKGKKSRRHSEGSALGRHSRRSSKLNSLNNNNDSTNEDTVEKISPPPGAPSISSASKSILPLTGALLGASGGSVVKSKRKDEKHSKVVVKKKVPSASMRKTKKRMRAPVASKKTDAPAAITSSLASIGIQKKGTANGKASLHTKYSGSKIVIDENSYPTAANKVRWILKKKGRRTGALVTRYFHIDEGYFVYYSNEDSNSPIGRINYLGAKIKVKSVSMLEIQCRSRTEPIFIDGFGNKTAMKVKQVLIQLQKDIEDINAESLNSHIESSDKNRESDDSGDDSSNEIKEFGHNDSTDQNVYEELGKLKKIEVAMSQKVDKNSDCEMNTDACIDDRKDKSPPLLKVNQISNGKNEEVRTVTRMPKNHVGTALKLVPEKELVETTLLKEPGTTENNNTTKSNVDEESDGKKSIFDVAIVSWTNEEVIEWLRGLKYDQYVPSFVENLIDGDLLVEMEDSDLKDDLNVKMRLHRVKLLKSIKKILKLQQQKGILLATTDGYSDVGVSNGIDKHTNATDAKNIRHSDKDVDGKNKQTMINRGTASKDGREASISSFSTGSSVGFSGEDGRSLHSVTSSFGELTSLRIDVEEEYQNHATIAAIFANPLVIVANGKVTPMPLLDWEAERKLLCRSLREAGGLAKLTFSHATTDVLRTVITKGCRVLHYSGHGNSNFLSFEDGAGLFHPLENERLKHLFAAGAGDSAAGNPKPKLVFVSACSSRKAAEAFLEAGAKHVVCVETLSEIEDRAAQAFTRAFYCALVRGFFVQDAFQIGQAAVETCPMVGRGVPSNAVKEANKFLLLPTLDSEDDERHRVSLFPRTSGNNLVEWIEPPPLSYEILPALPDGFVGRQLDIFNIVSTLIKRSRRIVSVIGEKGIGKSAIVKKAMHYLADRGSFKDGILYIHIAKNSSIEVIADELSSAHEERSFRKRHPQPLTPSERNLFVLDNNDVNDASKISDRNDGSQRMRRATTFGTFDGKNTLESITSHICRFLHSSECLIVLDDLEESCDVWPLISKILKSCHKVRFLITCISPLSSLLKDESGVHDYPEHIIQVTKMNINETARMIRSRVSRVNIRVDELISNYPVELANVSTPIKILQVARKLNTMPLCKEAFEL